LPKRSTDFYGNTEILIGGTKNMSITNQNAKAVQLQALEMAREYIENNQEIPNEISHILFPPEKREYELTYWGKESREQILSETIPVPLQEDRIFPPNATVNSNEWINKLIFGENLQILKTLIQMKKDGKLKNTDGTDGVRLIYIDPPFATKQEFKVNGEEQVAYADKLSGSEFIEFIRKRLILAKELLSNDGVIFVHLDQKMVHYIKVIMDEIFGKNNFRNEIVWKYFGPTSTEKNFPRKHDIILFYSKSSDYYFDSNATLINYDEKAIKRYDKVDENGKRYKIYKNKDGSERIAYMKQGKPTEVFEIPFVQGTSNERIGYPTQKPEKLLEILIKAVTKHGDLVMDFFAGSGTTPAVAEKLGRRWIAVDVGKYSIYTIQKRLLQINNIRPFMLYSGGLYDAEKLNKFDNENWKLFALQLWNCQVAKNTIRGLEFDGEKDNCLVKVYSPQELKKDNMKISYETISEIDVILGGNVGNEIFIIAPQGQFTFAEDEVEIKDRIYHILRVPYSMLAKFTENFTPPKQPRDSDSVNEIVDSVGFDFIQPPQVDFKIVKNTLQIKKFRSNSKIKGEQKTELAMVLIDYNYNGEIFDIDDILYNKDLYVKNTKTKESQLKKSIKIKTINKKAMFIFIDNAGNEKRVIIDGTK
jgi:site-specific DNA-methyltransferase